MLTRKLSRNSSVRNGERERKLNKQQTDLDERLSLPTNRKIYLRCAVSVVLGTLGVILEPFWGRPGPVMGRPS